MGTLIRTGKEIKELHLFEDRVDEITATTKFSDVKDCIQALKQELRKNRDLVALCAPQINKDLRLFVVKNSDNVYKAYLNPMIVNVSKGMHLSREDNASYPNKNYMIIRNDEVHLAYQTSDGHVNSESFKGAYSEIIQQMVQMLDGITLPELGLELGSDFDKASEEDKIAIMQLYLQSLENRKQILNDQIESNEELKLLSDTIKFNTRLLNGEIKPLDDEGKVVEYEVNDLGVMPKGNNVTPPTTETEEK